MIGEYFSDWCREIERKRMLLEILLIQQVVWSSGKDLSVVNIKVSIFGKKKDMNWKGESRKWKERVRIKIKGWKKWKHR